MNYEVAILKDLPPLTGLFRSGKKNEEMSQLLFLSLMSCIPGQSWFSISSAADTILAGINLPQGTVTLVFPVSDLEAVAKTGADKLPLPFGSGEVPERTSRERLKQFASR